MTPLTERDYCPRNGDVADEDARLGHRWRDLYGHSVCAACGATRRADAAGRPCRGKVLAPAPCPSCDGTGWAVLAADGHAYVGGLCRCVGGANWREGGG